MLNIRELLNKRTEYPISKNEDKWIKEVLVSDKQEEWIIVVSSFLHIERSKSELNAITEKFFVAGLYDLGLPFLNTGVRFTLVHFVRKKRDYLNIAIFKGNMFDKPNKKANKQLFELADEYSLRYTQYISDLEKWINEDIIPKTDANEDIEFNTIPFDAINWSKLYPDYYSKKAIRVRCLLEREGIIKLGDVADIICPKVVSEDKTSKTIVGRELRYPLQYDYLPLQKATSVLIQKNDILFSSVGEVKPYLVADEVIEDVYASPYIFVIRCKDIQPEYLFLYLNSEVGRIIIDSEKVGSFFHKVSLKTLNDIPVIIPKKDVKVYEEQAYALTHLEKSYTDNKAQQLNDLSKKSDIEQLADIEDVLSVEITKKIKLFDEEKVRTLLESDLRELNDCFKVKAYKAALILAGSILEAVLIDWLSDIKGVDYFKNEYVITRRDGSTKRAELIDYINEIKYIERPNWMEEANKAHQIRQKRNLVHAKLCLKSDDINEEVCKQVIEYLKDVLKTRGVK